MTLKGPRFVSLGVCVALASSFAAMAPASAATAVAPTIVDVAQSSSAALTGSTFSFTVVAENSTKQASAAYSLSFLLSTSKSATGATKVGSGTIAAIAAKTRKSLRFSVAIPATARAGDYRVLVCHPRAGRSPYCHEDSAKVTVSLAPAKLTFTPSGFEFGSVAVGTTSTAKRFVVRNVGRQASGAVSIALAGTQKASFKITSTTCGASLAPNGACRIDATFKPSATGVRKAALTATPSAKYSKGAVATLSGNGANPAVLEITPVSETFADQQITTSSTPKVFTVTNTGGVASGPILSALGGTKPAQFTKSADACNGTTLAAGASCDIEVAFSPSTISETDNERASLDISAAPGGAASAAIDGYAIPPVVLKWTPDTWPFPDTAVGASSTPKQFTLTNNGVANSGPIDTSILAANFENDFTISNDNCNTQSLAPGASCTVDVSFTPQSLDDQLTPRIRAEATDWLMPSFSAAYADAFFEANAVAPALLTMTPADYDFGNVLEGSQSDARRVTITNTGGQDAQITSLFFSGPDGIQFSISSDTNCFITLAGGSSCYVDVRFAPSSGSAPASFTASLGLNATAGGSPSMTLAGNSVATAANLTITPPNFSSSLNLGPNGQTSAKVTITNTGQADTGPVTYGSVVNSSDQPLTSGISNAVEPGFQPCGPVIAGGETCQKTFGVAAGSNGASSWQATFTAGATPGGTVSLVWDNG